MKIRTPDIPPEPVKTEVSYESDDSILTDENEVNVYGLCYKQKR